MTLTTETLHQIHTAVSAGQGLTLLATSPREARLLQFAVLRRKGSLRLTTRLNDCSLHIWPVSEPQITELTNELA